MTDTLTTLKARLREVSDLRDAEALLEWDARTNMPPGGAEARARQLSTVRKLAHTLFTAPETGKLIDTAIAAQNGTDYDSDDASFLRVARRDYERAQKLPAEFVAELAHVTTIGHEVWAKARAENDFKAFAPLLKRILELKIREAEYYGYTENIYDALLETYEPGMKTADVAAMFETLRTELVPLVQEISARLDRVSDIPLRQSFDEEKQREFVEMVVRQFGYDFERGRQDRTVHPFCTSFSRDDVRITTRYDPRYLNTALFGTMHEAGHGIYEQGSDAALEGNILRGGASLGVHESQSRLWENVIGRSYGFWSHFYPKLQALFPEQLANVSLEGFYRAINRVAPSLIRVEADEVTYNLHILVRFELETALLSGQLRVEDLPEAWNARYREYLGIVPPTDTLGVLQDVHWSSGLIGYFPTYTVGNLLSMQLYNKALEAYPSIPAEIAQGEFGTLLGWMREHVHKHGRKYQPQELVRRATGEPMQARPYMDYLRTKYSQIYDL